MVLRFLSVFALAALCACSATQVAETPWLPSPSGEWLTRIERSDTSGPGAGDLSETVQIRARASDKPVNVLTLGEMNGHARIELHWLDPTHLEIAYANGHIRFQAVKLGNLAITAVPLAR